MGTTATRTTDASGEAKLRGFYGGHDVTLKHGGKAITTVIRHAASGGRLAVMPKRVISSKNWLWL